MKCKKIKWIFYLLFIIYLGLFCANRVGYFEYKNYNKKLITEEKIKQFEDDIKNNKNVDIEEYLQKPVNYQSKLSGFTLKVSEGISKLTRKSIKGTLKFINKMVE